LHNAVSTEIILRSELLIRADAVHRFVQANTTIPVPRVHGYGRRQLRLNDPVEYAFVILDYVNGRPLAEHDIISSPAGTQRELFTDLIDIYAQLRTVEFPATGSLMPTSNGPPTVSRAFSIPTNELQIDGFPTSSFSTTSVNAFIERQLQVLWQVFSMPTSELSRSTAQLELFALHYLRSQNQALQAVCTNDHFVLAHMDLRCSNIMVDEHLRVRGIIDWEWSAIVPQTFSIPPCWIITNHLPTFRSILESRQNLSIGHVRLSNDWLHISNTTLYTIQILQEPFDLIRVFYKFIFPRIFQESQEAVLSDFFQSHYRVMEVDQRLRESEQYTEYLKQNNLFVIDEEAQRIRDWIAKGQKLFGNV
jgi:hypothetical protein